LLRGGADQLKGGGLKRGEASATAILDLQLEPAQEPQALHGGGREYQDETFLDAAATLSQFTDDGIHGLLGMPGAFAIATPFGGAAFVAGWIALALGVLRRSAADDAQ